MTKLRGKPKYEIYFKLKNKKRWLRYGKYYWNKQSAIKDLNWFRKNKFYDFKINTFRGYWK